MVSRFTMLDKAITRPLPSITGLLVVFLKVDVMMVDLSVVLCKVRYTWIPLSSRTGDMRAAVDTQQESERDITFLLLPYTKHLQSRTVSH